MDEKIQDELLHLVDKLDEEIGLIDTYVENHEGIKESTCKSIEKLIYKSYYTLNEIKEIIKYS